MMKLMPIATVTTMLLFAGATSASEKKGAFNYSETKLEYTARVLDKGGESASELLKQGDETLPQLLNIESLAQELEADIKRLSFELPNDQDQSLEEWVSNNAQILAKWEPVLRAYAEMKHDEIIDKEPADIENRGEPEG